MSDTWGYNERGDLVQKETNWGGGMPYRPKEPTDLNKLNDAQLAAEIKKRKIIPLNKDLPGKEDYNLNYNLNRAIPSTSSGIPANNITRTGRNPTSTGATRIDLPPSPSTNPSAYIGQEPTYTGQGGISTPYTDATPTFPTPEQTVGGATIPSTDTTTGEGGLSNWFKNLSPEGKSQLSGVSKGLMTAGLTMLAQKPSQYPISFAQSFGEGGLAGMGAYEQEMERQKTALELKRNIGIQTEQMGWNRAEAAQKAALYPLQKTELEQKVYLSTPLSLDEATRITQGTGVSPQTVRGMSREKAYEAITKHKEGFKLEKLTVGPDGKESKDNLYMWSIDPKSGQKTYVGPAGATPEAIKISVGEQKLSAGSKYLELNRPKVEAKVDAIVNSRLGGKALNRRNQAEYSAVQDTFFEKYPQGNWTAAEANARKMEDPISMRIATRIAPLNSRLETLKNKAVNLDNSKYPSTNAVQNWFITQWGDPRVKDFDSFKQSVVMEATQAMSGGVPTDVKFESELKAIDTAGSPAQLAVAIDNLQNALNAAKEGALGLPYTKEQVTGGGLPETGGQGAGKIMATLPPASQHTGKIIKSSEGKRYKSDGTNWIEVQ